MYMYNRRVLELWLGRESALCDQTTVHERRSISCDSAWIECVLEECGPAGAAGGCMAGSSKGGQAGPWPSFQSIGYCTGLQEATAQQCKLCFAGQILGKLVFRGCPCRVIGDPPELNKLWHAICLISPGNMCTPTGLCCRPRLWGHTKQMCQVHRLYLRGGPLWGVSSNDFQMDTRHYVRGFPHPARHQDRAPWW
jgi:hypothetical protein